MSATTHPTLVSGVRGQVRPSSRDLEKYLMTSVPGLTRGAANKITKKALFMDEPYAEAVRMGIDHVELNGSVCDHRDPTGEKASARADRSN